MIFIPIENIRTKWDLEKGKSKYIIWTYNEFVEIHFINYINDKFNSYVKEVHTVEDDKLSTSVRFEILKCPELACQAKPQLRYNAIIKKYFCECPSSMICTKDNDEAEIEFFKETNVSNFSEENGFFDDPLKAILFWQKTIANYYLTDVETILNRRFFK